MKRKSITELYQLNSFHDRYHLCIWQKYYFSSFSVFAECNFGSSWGEENLLRQFLFLKCNKLLCQKPLWNARRKYFPCLPSFIIVINNASCVHKPYTYLLLMFDGMAFKKSATLPNSKMFIYLFFFESRECGRTALTWCERAWPGDGQERRPPR